MADKKKTENNDSKKDILSRIFKRKSDPNKRSFSLRALDVIEKVGNKLPHPATLFAIFALLTLLFSYIIEKMGATAIHPGTGETIHIINLLSGDGFRYIWSSATDNFVKFPPLGIVLVAMIGVGVAEGSGLLTAMLRHLVISAPKRLITAAVVAAGVLSHLASSAGYVILIPLGALVFAAVKRHPLAGLAAAFCGVSAGFGANFLIGTIDPILSGLTESAANIIMPGMKLSAAINVYFMMASAVLVTIVGTWVTEKFVEPRLGNYTGELETFETIDANERKGLRWAGISVILTIVLFYFLAVPHNALLRDPLTNSILKSPFMTGLITGILIFFFIPGVIYGVVVGTIRNDKDVVKHMTNSMKGLSSYIVLVFFAAQFVYYFNKSNIGIMIAIKGAELLESIGFTGIGLVIAFVFVSAFINLFMGSASAKWAIMAPIFVPMFMLLGYHPAITQAAFRIGDSVTNVITPMMSYFALIVAFAQKYDEKAGLGTIIATMLPYTIFLSIAWILLLVVWMLLGLPIGPGAPIYMP